MTANDAFFQRKQAVAVLKHGILMRYPPVFATMTGSTSDGGRVVYLDGYAGPGRYEPEDGESVGAPGSPLLAVQSARTVAQWSRDLRCIFVERKAKYANDLKEALANDAGSALTYDVLEGDVENRLDEALRITGDLPLFAFLDPFGSALRYATMTDRLMGRGSKLKTEVLLNLNLEMVWRIGGILSGEEVDQEKSSTGKSATLERVDSFLGDAWWRQTFIDARRSGVPGSAAHAAQVVANEFCKRVAAATGYQWFSVPIRRRPNNNPLFLMILFYRHPAAPYHFNDAASGANQDWREHFRKIDLAEELKRKQSEPDLFGAEFNISLWESQAKEIETNLERQWVDVIASNIRKILVNSSSICIESSFVEVYGETLGLAREKHIRSAWDQLCRENLVYERDKKTKLRRLTIARR